MFINYYCDEHDQKYQVFSKSLFGKNVFIIKGDDKDSQSRFDDKL